MKPMNIILAIILLRVADVLWKHVSLIPTLAEATSQAGERLLPADWLEQGRIFTLLARWDGAR